MNEARKQSILLASKHKTIQWRINAGKTILICNKCKKEIKSLSEYYKTGKCRTCYNEYMRDYYNKNFKSDVKESYNFVKNKNAIYQ